MPSNRARPPLPCDLDAWKTVGGLSGSMAAGGPPSPNRGSTTAYSTLASALPAKTNAALPRAMPTSNGASPPKPAVTAA